MSKMPRLKTYWVVSADKLKQNADKATYRIRAILGKIIGSNMPHGKSKKKLPARFLISMFR
jgi:hypothetical protein